MAWSPVGNPGNAADPATGYGAVNYSYSIGTYDVTNAQYVAFLNANDPTGADPVGIYNSLMSDATDGGVSFNSGAPQGQMYSVMPGRGNYPADSISFWDAIRFANWMDNGEPIFTTEPTSTNNATEHGSYTLLGFTTWPDDNDMTRNAGATIVLPSENEWYKAAYYNPATSSYFLYPTSSNTAPNATGPTSTPNSANYSDAVGNLTAVGAYTGTTSPYGAYDMGGDLFQWDEGYVFQTGRILRGGWFGGYYTDYLQSSLRLSYPYGGPIGFGFRVALVPEPSSIVLAIVGCVGAFALRKRIQCWHGRQI